MARSEPALPPWLMADLAGHAEALEPPHHAYPVLSTDEDGWVHVALLSRGEVLCLGTRRLAIALWPGSGTTRNLSRTGRCVLEAVGAGGVDHVRLACRRCEDIRVEGKALATFTCDVVQVVRDVVGYASVTRGIEFELTRTTTQADWRATVAALRDLRCLGEEHLA
jgi:flavin reductase (DIM6/NTAB) family NADH-FMN oxidoreductase RutF